MARTKQTARKSCGGPAPRAFYDKVNKRKDTSRMAKHLRDMIEAKKNELLLQTEVKTNETTTSVVDEPTEMVTKVEQALDDN